MKKITISKSLIAVLVILAVSVGTVAGLWFLPMILNDNLTYELETPPTTYTGNGGTFGVTTKVISDVLQATVSIDGTGFTDEEITIMYRLDLLDTAYTLEAGYDVVCWFEDSGSVVAWTESNPDVTTVLDSGQTWVQWGASWTPTTSDTYSVHLEVTGMTWTAP